MRLSFIIPAYNEERYIIDCLASIYALKSLKDFEVIVADNMSTDRTVEVVREQFPMVQVVTAQKKGPAAARNAGAKIATGGLLVFIDADCRVTQEWFEKITKYFEKHKKIACLTGPYHFDTKRILVRLIERISRFVLWLVEMLFRRFLYLGGPAFGGNMVVPRDVFNKVGGFDERFEFYGEDITFAQNAAQYGDVYFDLNVWVYSSNRRFVYGKPIKMGWVYGINSLSLIIFKRLVYTKYSIIR